MSAAKVVRGLSSIPVEPMLGDAVKDVMKRVLISPAEGWDGWVMRLFEIAPGGHTPRHAHDWPHINFVAEGSGELHMDGEDLDIARGSAAFVPGGVVHQFTNTGDTPLSLICIVPERGES
jgi:quercetin dioxygenase-like cupin family protein